MSVCMHSLSVVSFPTDYSQRQNQCHNNIQLGGGIEEFLHCGITQELLFIIIKVTA